jgi:hypothetical protein
VLNRNFVYHRKKSTTSLAPIFTKLIIAEHHYLHIVLYRIPYKPENECGKYGLKFIFSPNLNMADPGDRAV